MFKENISETKKPVLGEREQVNPITGISQDYFNKYSFLISFYNRGGIENLKKEIKSLINEGVDTEIHTYSDAYKDYELVVNEKSKENILEIDELSTLLNSMIKDVDNIDEAEFIDICNRLNFLIYGKEDGHRDMEVKKMAEAA